RQTAGALLLHAYPDRVARARGALGRFVLANGRGAILEETDALARAPFLVVADLQGRAQDARIAAAAMVDEETVRTVLADRIVVRTESAFDPARRSVRVRRVERLGAILLSESTLPAPKGADADRAVLEAVRAHGLSLLPWEKSALALRARLAWL